MFFHSSIIFILEKMNLDLQDLSTVKIGYNTQQSPGDQKKFAVTQTPEKNTN